MSRSKSTPGVAEIISKAPSLRHFTVTSSTRIATLWSNYGSIDRVYVTRTGGPNDDDKSTNAAQSSIIVKTVAPPPVRGDADEGHLRKLLSYEAERFFYQHLSHSLPAGAKVAKVHPIDHSKDDELPVRLILEDLATEFPNPAWGSLGRDDAVIVLDWLATFHGTFWSLARSREIRDNVIPPPLQYNVGQPVGVWAQGTYWYLDTRRDELDSTDPTEYSWLLKWTEKVDSALKKAADQYGSLLHGDVKGANIVFSKLSSSTPKRCALYDFQYVGVGAVTRDLVYFLGTSVQGNLLRRIDQEKELLQSYHNTLTRTIGQFEDRSSLEYTFDKLWKHWELAIVDWYRFMAGWGFWGNDSWIEKRAREIVTGWEERGIDL